MARCGVQRFVVGEDAVRTTVLATEMAMPKTAPAAHDQPKPCETTMPSKVAAPIWRRAGQDDTLDGQQVFKMEVEAHAEHEQDDADFRALEAVSASATKPGE